MASSGRFRCSLNDFLVMRESKNNTLPDYDGMNNGWTAITLFIARLVTSVDREGGKRWEKKTKRMAEE